MNVRVTLVCLLVPLTFLLPSCATRSVTAIGSLIPSDAPLGELLLLRQVNGQYAANSESRKLSQLQRPTYTSYGDPKHVAT